jgi:(2Fe-2S) ferredoxin
MKSEGLPYKQVIFVCANARAAGERISCGGEGRCGVEVLEKLKTYIKKNNLQDVARAAKSGCQEKCELGPNAMVFPQNEFLSALTPADADAIIDKYLAPLRRP